MIITEKYNALREKHKEFIYHGYDVTHSGITFHFSIDEYHFYPEWKIDGELLKNPDEFTEYIIFNLGMAELISYWKCACPPVVRVKCGSLTEKQCRWWKKLYFNGLGEFFYRNGITPDFEKFMTIIPDNGGKKEFAVSKPLSGLMIPVGGGKDSIVTLELLKQYRKNTDCYIINALPAAVACARVAEFDDSRIVTPSRTIDKTLLELNKQGCLNGHTPFSAVVAFSAYLFAYLRGRKHIVLSNESSANESYVEGMNVNHQYSKSTEFEKDFREYVSGFLSGDINYFSFLRPLCEWQIAKKFVEYKQYFPVFLSCNLGSKANKWCGKCAKCLYVYILLAAFLDDDELIKIFGVNCLNEKSFSDMFDGLVYDGVDKPFECIGTKQEIRLSLYMAAQRRKALPVLLKGYMDTNPQKPLPLDGFYDNQSFLPDEFSKILKRERL